MLRPCPRHGLGAGEHTLSVLAGQQGRGRAGHAEPVQRLRGRVCVGNAANAPAVGARAAAPSARPPGTQRLRPRPGATAISPSSAATAAVFSMASAPRSTYCTRCAALSRRRSTSLGRPLICGGGCARPGRQHVQTHVSAASWGS